MTAVWFSKVEVPEVNKVDGAGMTVVLISVLRGNPHPRTVPALGVKVEMVLQ